MYSPYLAHSGLCGPIVGICSMYRIIMFIHLCIGTYRFGTLMIVKTESKELSGAKVEASEHFEHASIKV